jgi:glycosyltransferase involved in cell wall biosynthesis
MPILVITPGFPSGEADQNCIPALQWWVKQRLQEGESLAVVTLEYPFHGAPYYWHGVPVYPSNGQNRRWLKPRTVFRALSKSQEILTNWEKAGEKRLQVHSFWLGWAQWVGQRAVSGKNGVAHWTTLMGQDVLPQNWHLRRISPDRFEHLIAVSHFQDNALYEATGRRAGQVVPWGLSPEDVPEGPSGERSIDVLGVGSLIPVKNWDKWLAVIALAAKERPHLRAVLIGDGPERERLEKTANAYGLEQNLRFAGALPRNEVLEHMRSAKALLHSADFESFGYVFLEADANGAKIVSSPVGIAPEIGAWCSWEVAELAGMLKN